MRVIILVFGRLLIDAPERFSPQGVLAFLVDLGEISGELSEPLVFAIGALRNPSVEVSNALGETSFRSPYYMSNSESESIHDLVKYLSFIFTGFSDILLPFFLH